jgi:hypothetical protein
MFRSDSQPQDQGFLSSQASMPPAHNLQPPQSRVMYSTTASAALHQAAYHQPRQQPAALGNFQRPAVASPLRHAEVPQLSDPL